MGRGRAKAKQTKVARDLKYRTFDPDFSDLQRELHGEDGEPIPDQYAELADRPDLADRFTDRDAS
jgi:hypothetical protein